MPTPLRPAVLARALTTLLAADAAAQTAAGDAAPQGIAVSLNGGPTRPVSWVEGTTFALGDTFLIFRGGDLHLSGGSAYNVLKRQSDSRPQAP